MEDTCVRTGSAAYSKKAVYYPLFVRLEEAIRNGDFSPGEMIATGNALAHSEGLSRSSVRKAVAMLIREGLVERRAGKGVFVREASAVTCRVKIIVPNLEDYLQIQVAQGAQDFGGQRGVEVHIYDARRNIEMDLNIIKRLPTDFADGAIISRLHYDNRFAEALCQLKQANYPFVLVDSDLREINVNSIVSDNYQGGYAVGQELVRLGHRRVGVLGNMQIAETSRQRLEGFRDAIGDAGLPFDRSLVKELATDATRSDWRELECRCTREVMALPDPPTALFYSSDNPAAHSYLELKKMGLRIGHDVSVVGFDDSPIASLLDPPLASVRQPVTEMGQIAMEMLLSQLASPQSETQHRVLPVELISRASLGPPQKT
ncbi:MAG: hypothetical protein DRP83_09145 [Planctomycetota bacterium]|nr:MAG: hypothetical protein DRP83_09145 [Planctomycetota bacterium]